MVITVGRAIAWGVSGLLGIRRNEPVAHDDLQHAHWDPFTRTWFTHEAERDRFDARHAVGAPATQAAGPAGRQATTRTPHRRSPRRRRPVTGRVNRLQALDSRRQAVEAER